MSLKLDLFNPLVCMFSPFMYKLQNSNSQRLEFEFVNVIILVEICVCSKSRDFHFNMSLISDQSVLNMMVREFATLTLSLIRSVLNYI